MGVSDKIKSISELERVLNSERKIGKRIVLCLGVFDLVHPGHVLHLRAAREHGDILIVVITPDRYVNKGPGRPTFNEQLRMDTIAALEYVDYVALNEWPTGVESIHRLRPQIYVKGNDYAYPALDLTGKIIDEEKAIQEVGGEIRYTDEEVFSSSALINRYFNPYSQEAREYLEKFSKGTSADKIIQQLKNLASVRVLIVGEAILDQYCYCIPLAKSPKEFIIATKFSSEEHFAGGSVAIANHVAGYCNKVTLVTCLGSNNQQFDFFRSSLRSNVQLNAVRMNDRPTIVKRRFVEPTFLNKMFEVQYLDDTPLDSKPENELVSVLEMQLHQHDLVIVSDFGHGQLTDRIRALLCSSNKFLAVNTQTNSANLGFNPITKYERADYVCIHEGELRLAFHTQFGDLYEIATKLKEKLCVQKFMVTRGPNGSLLFSNDSNVHKAPALSLKVVDRVGAGDAFFAVTSPCVYREYDEDLIGLVGNCVGALAVETVGNRQPVDPTALYKFISHIFK